MRARVRLDNLTSEHGKLTILRNLSRIMHIRVVDIDIQSKVMCFLYQNNGAYDEVKKELHRIGYPIQKVLLMIKNSKRKQSRNYEYWEPSLD